MKGRIWLILGVVVGVAIGIGKLPYFEGAATSLCDTALRVVDTGGLTLIHGAANHGVPRRVIEGFVAILAILVPGLTALLLVVAARTTLRLREVIGVLLAALGIASFFYLPGGTAVGVALLALLAAGLVVAVTGPVVVAPLSAIAALIATVFLPKLVRTRSSLPTTPISDLHRALFATSGAPLWLRVIVLVLAALPFALAARLALRGSLRR
jgi:hypothetical protein